MTGSGTIENMLDGYNWVVNNATAEGKIGSSLVSMSLGWPTSQVINDAVEAAFQAGLLTVVSAGNDEADASTKSPASAPNALTVGATDFARARAWYSNYGSLVDVWGPGNDVLSLAPAQGETAVKSGTSMSTPLVAGLAAYLRSLAAAAGGQTLDDPAAATARVKELALQGVVGDVKGSANLFAHNGAGNGTSVLRRRV
ncbi:Suppressor of the cold-sensitive snRNP biogenesis mutant brr1-1 [Diatrype stigma]|uniref:Suppressor of the cold-sensitive snRNP biogenesis mutant brr1-1 n=1 Tax=Diatrype stigma TaxID=117547 RepID=A0AAN9YRC2_9PEZI